jgi:PPOX class probable FMN-dependent enzyme
MDAHDPYRLDSEAALRTVYAEASPAVKRKSLAALDQHSRHFLELCPFFCIGSHGPDGGGDVSPRGGEPGLVEVLDDRRIAFADRPGNNRLDTLVNLVTQPAVGMLFFLPGVTDMMRINGLAHVTVAPDLMARFVHDGKLPRSIVVVAVQEVYFHCSKALIRSELWNPARHLPKGVFPTLGQIARDQFRLPVEAAVIDQALAKDAADNLY